MRLAFELASGKTEREAIEEQRDTTKRPVTKVFKSGLRSSSESVEPRAAIKSKMCGKSKPYKVVDRPYTTAHVYIVARIDGEGQ